MKKQAKKPAKKRQAKYKAASPAQRRKVLAAPPPEGFLIHAETGKSYDILDRDMLIHHLQTIGERADRWALLDHERPTREEDWHARAADAGMSDHDLQVFSSTGNALEERILCTLERKERERREKLEQRQAEEERRPPEREAADLPEASEDNTPVPVRVLAKRYRVPEPALRRRLDRFRSGNDNCFIEVANPVKGEARYSYYPAAAMHIIEALQLKRDQK